MIPGDDSVGAPPGAPWRGVVAWGLLFAALIGVGTLLPTHGRAALRFEDSKSYLWLAAQPLDLEFFASRRAVLWPRSSDDPEAPIDRNRPFLLPLLYKIVGGDPQRIVVAQQLTYALAAGCALALLVLGCSRRRARALVILLGLPLALWWNLSGWSLALLPEALTLAALWLATGALGHALVRAGRGAGLAAAVGTTVVFAREHIGLWLALLVAIAGLLAPRGRPRGRRALFLASLVVLGATAIASWLSLRAGRNDLRTMNVFFHRVAVEPDGIAWFEARGMPWRPELEALVGRRAYEANLLLLAPEQAPFRAWFAAHGNAAYARYLATHPLFLWRSLADALPFLAGRSLWAYTGPPPAGFHTLLERHLPLFGPLGFSVLSALALLFRRRLSEDSRRLARFAVGLAATSVAFGLFAFLVDAAEPERHCFLTGVGIELAALVLVASLAEGRGIRAGTATEATAARPVAG